MCGLGPEMVGIYSISYAARYRVAACSSTLNQGLDKIQTARGHTCAPIFALDPPWPVAPRMLSVLFVAWTVMANLVKFRRIKSRRLLLDCFLTNHMNKALLCLFPFEALKSWDRSVVIELRTSCPHETCFRVLLVLDSLLVSFASLVPRYAQLRDFILKSMIIRVVLDAQMNLTLSHITTSVPGCMYDIFTSFWGHTTVLPPQRNHLLHDLITRVFLRSLQCWIVLMGFIDAFVYAHHQHRGGLGNSGNFGDHMKGRIRFMTAITPAYTHACQTTCLSRTRAGYPGKILSLPKPQSQISVPSKCSFDNT